MSSLRDSQRKREINEFNAKKPKWFCIPVRYIVAFLALMGTFNLYLCRINLSIAIVAMSKFNKSNGNGGGNDICIQREDINNNSTNTTQPPDESRGEFEWDEKTQGVILGAFFYGYIIFQVVGGRLSEVFGAKWLCGGGIAMSIVINALTPVIARSGYYWLLLTSRVVMGMFQAFIFPSCYALFSRWAPDHERSTFLTFPTIGGNIGTIATSGLSGYLSDHGFAGGWPSVFYVSAIIAFIWLLCWLLYVSSEPRDHKWISSHELHYIQSNISANNNNNNENEKTKRSVPWLHIFTSMPIIATIITKFTINWNYILFLLKLPSYLQTVFHFSVSENGLINSCVYIVITISLFLAGFLSDYFLRKEIIHKTYLRKIFQSLATFGSAICLSAIPLAKCNTTLVIALLMIAMLLFGMMGGGDIPVVADMTNKYTATVFAIANTVAFSCGFITPLVVGLIVEANKSQPRLQWSYVFYMSSAINVFGGIVFAIFGSADQQHWDKDHKNEDKIVQRI